MEKNNFIDQIRVFCRSGNGGNGSIHFMRTKYKENAGPDGGNGGRGAHIILRGNKNIWTLLHLRYKKNILASNGESGSKNNCSGKNGTDVIIDVPLGTIVRDEVTDKIEAEILDDKQEIIWMRGGRGGMGNAFFKRPTLQTPLYAQDGELGSEGWKIIELKILADIGLVGFPNAGKSTLLSKISAAKPKIANFAFTTKVPNLGMVQYDDKYSFCIADLPGIIEGASEGKGLGLRFLRHIERNSALLFVLSAEAEDIKKEYKILITELKNYNPLLLNKKIILGVSKSEMIDAKKQKDIIKQLPKKQPVVFFSSFTQQGLAELKKQLWISLQEINN